MKGFRWTATFDSKTKDGEQHKLCFDVAAELIRLAGFGFYSTEAKDRAEFALPFLAKNYGATEYTITGPEEVEYEDSNIDRVGSADRSGDSLYQASGG